MQFISGLSENFLLAKRIFRLKWKTTITDVTAAAIARPVLPYAKRQMGMPIFPVLGSINGGSSLYISLLRIFSINIPKIANNPTYKKM